MTLFLFRYHCMNTALIMISTWVQFVNPELDLEEGSIGIKIVGQSNKRIDSVSPCTSMQIPNLMWLKNSLPLPMFAWMPSTENIFMCFIHQLLDDSLLWKESWAKTDKKCKIWDLRGCLGHKTIGSDLIPILSTHQSWSYNC